MVDAKKSTWIGGTVVASLAIVAGSWFLAISPTLADAADSTSQAATTRQQNDLLQLKIAKLKADFAKLPEYKATLKGLQVQIPTDLQLADYLRQLDAIAVARSMTLTAISPATPTTVVPAAIAETAPKAAATATSTDSPTSSPTAASSTPATTGSAASGKAPAGFAAIPVSITVVGTYANGLEFMDDLQNATPRLFLVSGLTVNAQGKAAAGGGKPAMALGDVELVITGFTYVLPDVYSTPTVTSSTAPTLPSEVPGKNPLVPIGGVK